VQRYPDGVHVAELASLSRPDLVPQTVASVLDVPLPETGPAEVALARQLAERRLLLVLDNCEHLLDACARLAAALLRTCPDVVVLRGDLAHAVAGTPGPAGPATPRPVGGAGIGPAVRGTGA
jgi:predicted ATPase